MLDYLSQPSSSRRVQSWLESMHYHASSLDEDEKSSLVSNKSTKNSIENSNRSSRKNLSSSSFSSSFNTNRADVRRIIHLRRPRYLVRRFRGNKKLNKKFNKNSDFEQSSSYFSNKSLSADESNLFSSNLSGLNFLNSEEQSTQMPEIRADDLEFDNRHSFTSSSNGSYCSNNYSTNNHQFGILDFENWDSSLKLEDDLKFKVKTYAFSPKDIKIKIKDNVLIVIGKQQVEEENGWFKREFKKKFDLPSDSDKKNIKYDFDKNDHLIITVPRTIHSVH